MTEYNHCQLTGKSDRKTEKIFVKIFPGSVLILQLLHDIFLPSEVLTKNLSFKFFS